MNTVTTNDLGRLGELLLRENRNREKVGRNAVRHCWETACVEETKAQSNRAAAVCQGAANDRSLLRIRTCAPERPADLAGRVGVGRATIAWNDFDALDPVGVTRCKTISFAAGCGCRECPLLTFDAQKRRKTALLLGRIVPALSTRVLRFVRHSLTYWCDYRSMSGTRSYHAAGLTDKIGGVTACQTMGRITKTRKGENAKR